MNVWSATHICATSRLISPVNREYVKLAHGISLQRSYKVMQDCTDDESRRAHTCQYPPGFFTAI